MRPRLRTFISDVYKDVSYVLDEDNYAQAGYNDIVRKRFVKSWETLVDGYKDTFTENNYRLLFGLALDILVRPWERFISQLRYSEVRISLRKTSNQPDQASALARCHPI